MYQLVYVSSAIDDFEKSDLEALLEHCRSNNQRLGITGLLVFREGRFLQVLEGEKETVDQLAECIRKDERHWRFLRLMTRELPERQFSDWSMAFQNMDENPSDKHEGLEEILCQRLVPGEADHDERLKGYLRHFEESFARG